MIDTVQFVGPRERRCRTRVTGVNATIQSIADVAVDSLECPECKSSQLAWAYRFENPHFKLGAMACQKCGRMYDVTPRN